MRIEHDYRIIVKTDTRIQSEQEQKQEQKQEQNPNWDKPSWDGKGIYVDITV